MSIPSTFASFTGAYAGTNRLWLDPSAPPAESATTLTAGTTAQGKFLTLAYTWSHEGAPHDGLMVVGQNPEGGVVQVSWVDSFHTAEKIMSFDGVINPDGSIVVKGSYTMEGYGTWGWHITLLPPTGDSFTLKMDNIDPDGTHYPAVEGVYKRTSSA
jgi:hypothetical protein